MVTIPISSDEKLVDVTFRQSDMKQGGDEKILDVTFEVQSNGDELNKLDISR